MKSKILMLAVAAGIGFTPAAMAADSIDTFSIQEAMNSQNFKDRLGDFTFVWGDSVSGQRIMSTSTRKATNGINKSDKEACEWALLSALIAFKEQAISKGGTSVQGIKSNVTGQPFSSTTEFQCKSGWTNSRVYLEAEIVK
ncbi:MAG: excinuclease ATPase [Ponticaulis sp.]|nr:excinuclease ATPase [Ponticaulis sp.]